MAQSPSATTHTVGGQVQHLGVGAMRGLRSAARAIVRMSSALMRTWRRSLQFRVVTTTVLLGIMVVSLLGSYLYNEIATGLQDDRIQTSEYEARALTTQAQDQWDSTTATTVQELNQAASDIMKSKLTPPGPEPSRYVVKPFKPQELIARVRARLRRDNDAEPERLTIGDLVIDVAGHSVKREGESLSLTPLEFDLLVALARKPWQVFTREVLLEQVWGYRHAGDTRLVNVHVQRLRSKIEKDPERPEIVVTVRGVGYRAGPA